MSMILRCSRSGRGFNSHHLHQGVHMNDLSNVFLWLFILGLILAFYGILDWILIS